MRLTQLSTPGIPSSRVIAVSPTQDSYCVVGYAPGRPVTVTTSGGSTATIHTDYLGTGCTLLPHAVGCTSTDNGVATGVGADGNPATSSATLTSSGTATCTPSAPAHSSASGGGSSGTALGVALGVVGLAILAGMAVWLIVRRRGPG